MEKEEGSMSENSRNKKGNRGKMGQNAAWYSFHNHTIFYKSIVEFSSDGSVSWLGGLDQTEISWIAMRSETDIHCPHCPYSL